MVDEYAGLGSGSIGYLSGVCYANTFDIAGTSPRSRGASCRSRPPASFPSGTGSGTIF